ncbi:MAG: translation initiation factor IF-2 [Anaerolineaceae bacterium]|nr:translation initiation factor IF-2 [Anaerolineaceae bacterium]
MSENGQNHIELPISITVRELALRVQTSPIEVIKILMANGVMANINQLVDFDTAAVVATELGFETDIEVIEDEEEKEIGEIPYWRQLIANEDPQDLVSRPPVVTILGHVDHGKTTLLDAIRQTEVASGEYGGITQHIGAYQIEHKNRLITFLDTPGHAAFTAMRARGAQGADIVVLVVAANDGVMPQTKEAIAHAQAARVPIIVALNKMDRADANPEFVKRQLSDDGLVPDEWDGETIIIPVSATEAQGLNDLLEAILLVADSRNILANPIGEVFGTVIEAELDRTKGVLASLLIQNGTLKKGEFVVAGTASGRIRAMENYHGASINKAGPSTPVQILGLNDVPKAGNRFQVFSSEKEGRQFAEDIKQKELEQKLQTPKVTLEELFENFQTGEVRELRLVIKADVNGSLEPIVSSLNGIESGEISVHILYAETGNISESDVMLATASKAIVLGFNVKSDANARRLASTEGVSIRLYNIIYRLTDDIEKALKGMLEPEYKEVEIGQAQVLEVFRISKIGNVAGCRVTRGEIRRNARVRIRRGDIVVFNGEISSLKHEKDNVREVRQGFDCGISMKGFNDIEVDDVIEGYTLELVTF